MTIIDVLEKKKQGKQLTDEEIQFFVKGYTNGTIMDYQASALLMAICIKGMCADEIYAMTREIALSGDSLDLSQISGIKADKHSSGGVGDKTTPVVASIVAACGVKMAKMSGRGLGYTGGTVDKMESIPGFRTDFSLKEIISQVNHIGVYLGGQTQSLAPADKKLYALRDVTATVESIPLIASSIMSKKIVSGADVLVLDVKAGNGALMKSVEDAVSLAKLMVQIGNAANIKTTAVVTDMNEPLGYAVGNALEIREVIDLLNNRQSDVRLRQLCLSLAAHILCQAGMCSVFEQAYETAEEALRSGKAMRIFRGLIEAQGGNSAVTEDASLLPQAKYTAEVKAEQDGFIERIDCGMIGKMSVLCGAGRLRKEDTVDYGAGIVLHKKCADRVCKGDVCATVYTEKKELLNEIVRGIQSAYHIDAQEAKKEPLIYITVTE